MIHAVISSYFGDYEFDIGKSVRWAQYFVDDVFIVDSSMGSDSRNWVVAWDKTFPGVKYATLTGFPFFRDADSAAQWRATSFRLADTAYGYADDDYVLFLDTTDGLGFENTFTPTGDPFLEWLQSEIVAGDVISMPFVPYVNEGPVQYATRAINDTLAAQIAAEQATALGLSDPDARAKELARLTVLEQANTSTVFYAIPSYYFEGYVVRLVKVSTLRGWSISDWGAIDSLSVSPVGASASHTHIISYAYAHFSSDQATRTAPPSEALDEGWAMRKLISRVRPIADLQTTDWATPDPVGATGPNPYTGDPGDFPIDTPLYPVFRSNLRDGVFYQTADLGPVPWDQVGNRPAINPTTWLTQGGR